MKTSLIFIYLFAASCGSNPKKSEQLPEAVYSVISLSSSTSAESKSYSFTTLFNCKFDGNTGTFDASFNSGTNTNLSVKIRGFSKSNKKYTCNQAADNKNTTDVGSYFDGCGISLTIPNTTAASSTHNKYATYRTDTTVDAFAYAGDCSVDITFAEPSTISGVLLCGDMVQTHLKSNPRNPIDTNVKASIGEKSSFSCKI